MTPKLHMNKLGAEPRHRYFLDAMYLHLSGQQDVEVCHTVRELSVEMKCLISQPYLSLWYAVTALSGCVKQVLPALSLNIMNDTVCDSINLPYTRKLLQRGIHTVIDIHLCCAKFKWRLWDKNKKRLFLYLSIVRPGSPMFSQNNHFFVDQRQIHGPVPMLQHIKAYLIEYKAGVLCFLCRQCNAYIHPPPRAVCL